MSRIIEIIPEIRDAIVETGAEDIFKCYQCGKCYSICPWYQVEAVEFPIYRIPQAVKLGIIASSEDKDVIAREVKEIYRCVGCEACMSECPRGVGIQKIIRAVRRIFIDYGTRPEEIKSAASKLFSSGNPMGEPAEKRNDWAKDMAVPSFSPDKEYLYSPCCIPAYDTTFQRVAQSTARILTMAGVSYGILGKEEVCCGEAIRRAGSEKVFTSLAKSNISAYQKAGVKNIIFTSPHCYTTFTHEYTEFGGDFKVFHITQLFHTLIKENKIKPEKPFEKKVVYHDPCTLGRQNGIYDEPREVLKSIPGLELVEVKNFNRLYSVCCGGGGGGIWLDTPVEERITNVRLNQLAETGAEIIAVACPYCLQMFEDGVKVMNLKIDVRDISELLFEAINES